MLLTLVALVAAQSNLDAAIDTRPTVRSEIRRGYAAADECFDTTNVPTMSAADCIAAAEERNHQAMGSGYEAFDAGLYFGANQIGTIMLDAIVSHPGVYSPGQVHTLQSSLSAYSASYRVYRDRLKLTDGDVTGAAHGD